MKDLNRRNFQGSPEHFASRGDVGMVFGPPAPPPPPHLHGGPLPPHLMKALVTPDFTDQDWEVLLRVYQNEDTAAAQAQVIMDAPPEIQIVIMQLFHLIEEVA